MDTCLLLVTVYDYEALGGARDDAGGVPAGVAIGVGFAGHNPADDTGWAYRDEVEQWLFQAIRFWSGYALVGFRARWGSWVRNI